MNTLFDKIWDSHVVTMIEEGPTQLYIDRLYCHEVTSPQAFASMRRRGLKPFRPERIYCMPDHNTPTHDQDKPIEDPVSKNQVDTLAKNAAEFGLTHYGMMDERNGIIHVVGPERGLTLPGMTIVCGDSHTSTHGAVGAVAFGIGTSEVEMVMASQCILQAKPKTMRICVEGNLGKGVTAKDVALYIMSKVTTSGATGYFIEYAGAAIRSLTMEGRLTLCNLSIEMGARGGMIAPDETTFAYLKGRENAPAGEEWDKAVAYWKTLKSGDDAVFDKEILFDAADIEPMVTYGTNPGMGMGVTEHIPTVEGMNDVEKASFMKSMEYMGFEPGESLLGKKIDYVFLGSCTNGRIEDFRAFASIVKGRKKADHVVAWLVPGSWLVDAQIREEGLDKIFEEAGFQLRQPGCSACLAMNDDKIPAGKYAVSTSNRNFEGRSGTASGQVYLVSPETAAVSALTGVFTNPQTLGEKVDIAQPEHFLINDNMVEPPAPVEEMDKVEVLRGPNIKEFPTTSALEETITAKALLKVGDNITTDHIMPAGAKILPYRSNIPYLSNFCFAVCDEKFPERCRKEGPSIVIGGSNYGQGSSREHAALVPLYLGVKAVVAKSFARIHCANLANAGILPFTFKNEADYDTIDQMDELELPNIRTAIANGGKVILKNKTKGTEIELEPVLTERQRDLVLAGGLLNYTREQNQ